MRYLAVLNKGLYICNDITEENELSELFKEFKTEIFEEYEEDEAKEWAETSKIMGFKKEEKEHEFIEVLKEYRKQGYAYVDILLINGKSISILIDDILFFSTKYRCKWNYSEEKLTVSQDSDYLTPDTLDYDFQTYLDEVKSHTTEEEAIKRFFKAFKYGAWGQIWYELKKTNIKINNSFITFDKAYAEIEEDKSHHTYSLGFKLENISILLSNIIMITPKKIKNEITNSKFKKGIKKIDTKFFW
ncbi:hypothetical protein [Thomasclavelia cocleata]|uniref:hypothetical protein n=1 Tax=Thomasclavelia cocleata TaxID=69824 RepID=UPI00256F1EF2|nr:hypothetical protein [Thomasclavelia cocleata]